MATLYFNSSIDNDWNNLGNWWLDESCTIQADTLPTNIDDVIFISKAQCLSNSGSTPTVKSLTLN